MSGLTETIRNDGEGGNDTTELLAQVPAAHPADTIGRQECSTKRRTRRKKAGLARYREHEYTNNRKADQDAMILKALEVTSNWLRSHGEEPCCQCGTWNRIPYKKEQEQVQYRVDNERSIHCLGRLLFLCRDWGDSERSHIVLPCKCEGCGRIYCCRCKKGIPMEVDISQCDTEDWCQSDREFCEEFVEEARDDDTYLLVKEGPPLDNWYYQEKLGYASYHLGMEGSAFNVWYYEDLAMLNSELVVGGKILGKKWRRMPKQKKHGGDRCSGGESPRSKEGRTGGQRRSQRIKDEKRRKPIRKEGRSLIDLADFV